jgi:putative RNA 2'-phosphotransferase
MTTSVQISKTLSLWLRHRPDKAGLILTAAGWAEVDAVLVAFGREGSDVSHEQLQEVVEQNDKQRFELSADGTMIRARQGHSIGIQGDWPQATPPEHLYHGTIERFLASIMTDGLKPMRRHHVHLSADVATAERVGERRGSPVILRIAAERLAASGQAFYRTSNNVWLTAHVPLHFIERL